METFYNNANISCFLCVKVSWTSAKHPTSALIAVSCVKCHKFSWRSSTKLVQWINLAAYKSHLLLYVCLVFKHSPQSIKVENCCQNTKASPYLAFPLITGFYQEESEESRRSVCSPTPNTTQRHMLLLKHRLICDT